MRILIWLAVFTLFPPTIRPQTPTDISLTLATKSSRTQFSQGEAIPVELRFQSRAPDRYRVWTNFTDRCVRSPRYDHFTVTPDAGVVDPLTDIFAQQEGELISGRLPTPSPLPAVVELYLNEWLSIRRPGHFRLSVESSRVVLAGNQETSVSLRSNTVEIDVVPAEPGWAAARLKDAAAVLEREDPRPPAPGQPFDPRERQDLQADAVRAAQTLRFLESVDAARAMVRFFEHGPSSAQRELHAGLFATPHRRAVVEAMEEAIGSPDVSVTYYYIGTLMEFVEIERMGPTPPYTARTTEEIKRWVNDVEGPRRAGAKAVEDEYFAKLAQAVKSKRGAALSVSLDTLINRGPRPAPASLIQALAENFSVLPDMTKQQLLTANWPNIASASLEPFLQSVARGSTPSRDAALLRLQEMDPKAARDITIERIRNADIATGGAGSVYRSLMILPDKTLPELDGALVGALEAGKPVERLIARYASADAAPGVKRWFESNISCDPHILAYLFRVDPVYAVRQLQVVRQSQHAACPLSVSPNEFQMMSPGLEHQALEDLSSADRLTVRAALTLLERGAHSDCRGPLLEGMSRFRENAPRGIAMANKGVKQDFVTALNQGIKQGIVTALLTGSGWVLPAEQIDRMLTACDDDFCRSQAKAARDEAVGPVGISFLAPNDLFFANVGRSMVGSQEQLQFKISKYPRGTSFYLSDVYYEGTWWYEQKKRLLQSILEATSMHLVAAPPRSR